MPLTVAMILCLVSLAVLSVYEAILMLVSVLSSLLGGVLARSGTHFGISAAVGFISLFGVALQGGLIPAIRIRDPVKGMHDLWTAIMKSAAARMGPVLMTSLAATIGTPAPCDLDQHRSPVPTAPGPFAVRSTLTSAVLILILLDSQRLHQYDVISDAFNPGRNPDIRTDVEVPAH